MESLIGVILANKYKINYELGRGGMSIVYHAQDTHINKTWAVKMIPKSKGEAYVQTQITEANMMKQLDNHAFPRVVDILENEEAIFVVMDLVEGESLDKRLKTGDVPPEKAVVEWMLQIVDAVSYLHRQTPPIVYQDMKPANLMFNPERAGSDRGSIKIIDLGTAREMGTLGVLEKRFGTKGYAAPEQFDRTREPDQRTDIYCLGMTMHHLLTGQDPTVEGYEYRPLRQWNPYLSEGLEHIIDRCRAENPDERFQTCEELRAALEDYEKDTYEYRKMLRGKVIRFVAAAAACVIFGVSALGVRIADNAMTKNDYEDAVGRPGDYEQRISEDVRAIKEIDPSRLEAFEDLLDAYESEGRFGPEESQQISGLLPLYTGDKADEDYLELLYHLGFMYMSYYEEDGDAPFAKRATRANEVFSQIQALMKEHKITFDNAVPFASYYKITSEFSQHNGLGVAKERSQEELEALLQAFSDCISSMDRNTSSYSGDDAQFIRLSQCSYFANLINSMVYEFRDAGVPQSSVEAVYEQIQDSEQGITLQKLKTDRDAALEDLKEFKDNLSHVYYE